MKASEFRIGNLLTLISGYKPDETFTVNRKFFTELSSEENPFIPECYQPIILTEEWLLRFGFYKYSDKEFYVYNSREDEVRTIKTETGWNIAYYITNTQFVHQLQNLYFALTGEELELKE
jgi:hypothetical protein